MGPDDYLGNLTWEDLFNSTGLTDYLDLKSAVWYMDFPYMNYYDLGKNTWCEDKFIMFLNELFEEDFISVYVSSGHYLNKPENDYKEESYNYIDYIGRLEFPREEISTKKYEKQQPPSTNIYTIAYKKQPIICVEVDPLGEWYKVWKHDGMANEAENRLKAVVFDSKEKLSPYLLKYVLEYTSEI